MNTREISKLSRLMYISLADIPAKTNLQDHARLCKNLAWHVHAICPFSCTILAPILARSCKKMSKLAGSYSCSISCKILHHFLQRLCKNHARLCKNRARKGTYRVHVPSKSCMQVSCTILHDLASSFLLGLMQHAPVSTFYL